jgi:Glyoxalase/Bleomycin resistance protein/Dioxygenase superfamily
VRVFVRDIVSAKLIVETVGSDAPLSDLDFVGRFTGLSFDLPNADAAHRDLRSRGVTFAGDPERQSSGDTLATFEDPSGNKLQICEQPHA